MAERSEHAREPETGVLGASEADPGPPILSGLDERELAEVRALAGELGMSTQMVLKRVKEARGLLAPHGPLLAFVHIPKTAGGTVTNMFVRAYSRAGVHAAGNAVRGPETTERKVARRPGGWEAWHRRGGRVTVGHVPYGLFRKHLPSDTLYITFLREPVDRVLSHYHRHVHQPQLTPSGREERRQAGRATAASLEEALVEQRLPQLSNLATRFLCDRPSPLGDLPASALDDAKANLRRFAFVGIQERFEESVLLLQRNLGLEPLPYVNRHVSVEGGRPAVDEITDGQRSLIEQHNRLDLELYGFGLQLFKDAIAAPDETFLSDVDALEASSANLNEEVLRRARDWLDRELPVGSTRPAEALRAAAKASGIPIPALLDVARRTPSLETNHRPDGQKVWIRAEAAKDLPRANGADASAA